MHACLNYGQHLYGIVLFFCHLLTALNWTSTKEHFQNQAWLCLWISMTSEGLSPKHRWIHSGRQTHPYLLCKTCSSYKTLGLHTHVHVQYYTMYACHCVLKLHILIQHIQIAQMHVLNRHITRLAHMPNSTHDNNSTCVPCQQWRQRFSTLFSVKITHSFLLCAWDHRCASRI